MKVLLLYFTAVCSLQYLTAVIHSQEVGALPPLRTLWHPNLYIAKDDQGSHVEVRDSGRGYAASLSFLQQQQRSPSDVMSCRCRFESQGRAPGPGSFLQKQGQEVTVDMQEEGTEKLKGARMEIPLSAREDAPQWPRESDSQRDAPLPTPMDPLPQSLPAQAQVMPLYPAPPSQLFQQLPLPQSSPLYMYVPMMFPQSQYFPPQNYYAAQPAYVPQQPTYLPQQPTYIPQQPTYIPQQPGYISQQASYPSQQSPPPQQSYPPEQSPDPNPATVFLPRY